MPIIEMMTAFLMRTVAVIAILVFLSFLLIGIEPMIQSFTLMEDVVYLANKQLILCSTSGLAAIVIAISSGILLSRSFMRPFANAFMQLFNLGITIPVLALLAFAMILFGIGFWSAWWTLVFVSILPMARNSWTAFRNCPPQLLETGRGMGMNSWQLFWYVELPNALRLMLTGIRIGMTFNIGSAPLVFLIGAESLGELIFIGLKLNEPHILFAGSFSTALMAILVDVFFNLLALLFVSRGLQLHAAAVRA